MNCEDCWVYMPQGRHSGIAVQRICKPCRQLRWHYIESYTTITNGDYACSTEWEIETYDDRKDKEQ